MLDAPETQWVRACLLRPLDYMWVESHGLFGLVLRVETDAVMGLVQVHVMGVEPVLCDMRDVVEVPLHPVRAVEWNAERWAAAMTPDEA